MRKITLFLILIFVTSINANTLNSYAVAKLSSKPIAEKIRMRFKATGTPLFLIHDSKKGIALGDFIKFKDKIVLIDGQVWQTLATEKVFENISKIAVSTVKGSAASSDWYNKSSRVKTEYSRKSYVLGAEILKIFEEQFSKVPRNERVIINFNGGRATLQVPDRLINSLKLQKVTRSVKKGKMIWTVPPCDYAYLHREFQWQVWAADPAEPSGSISYGLSGTLPQGLRWSSSNHTIEGVATEPGTYPLRISAKSPKQTISMTCTLELAENTLPKWSNVPDTMRVSERKIEYPIILSDYESPSRDLGIVIDSLPVGFHYNRVNQSIVWSKVDSLFELNGDIKISITDPVGDVSRYSVPVYFEPDGVDVGYTFASLTPPWDTLVEGVTYKWNINRERHHWRRNHLQMKLGKVSDTAYLKDSILVMKPKKVEDFGVEFRFRDRDKHITEYQMVLPVIANRPPYFEAFPDKWDIDINDMVFFTPKAADPEGEDVEITLRSADSGFVYNSDGRLSFSAQLPGTYQAYLEAKDSFGNVSVQQVTYFVKKVYDRFRGFKLENGVWPGSNSWSNDSWGYMHSWRIHGEVPALRFGIFSPDDCNMFSDGPFRFPFIYFGTDLVPPHKRAEGKSAAVDLGFSYNISTREIHTFGLYLNVEAKTPVKQLFNSQLDFRFLFFARHLLRKISVNHTINDDGTLDYEAVKNIELLEEFISPNNLNIFLGATQWFHMGYGMFVGPTFQMRAAPVAMTMWEEEDPENSDSLVVKMDQSKNIYTSMVGIGFRHDLKVKRFQFENKFRLGYGGQDYGMMLYWDSVLGFGRFKR